MNVLLVEPYYTGSHAAWADGVAKRCGLNVRVLALGGNHWKWRMHGGAVTLARQFLESDIEPDVILATDMLDVTTFLALTRRRTARTPIAVYFHENQLTYPWSPQDRDHQRTWDRHYAFINLSSALAADRVFFNSRYHLESFIDALPVFLKQFPDHRETGAVERIREKSEVLPLGLDLKSLDATTPEVLASSERGDRPWPLILWNHRWEYDKNPEEFFAALQVMVDRGHLFDIALVGEVFDVIPKPFLRASYDFGDRIVQSGFVPDRSAYASWLWKADILPVTSRHEFFGAAVMEAVYCRCLPMLPRRLAYPELVPASHHDQCLYDSFDQLVEMLDHAIRNYASLDTDPFRKAASVYDWQAMGPAYASRLNGLIRSDA